VTVLKPEVQVRTFLLSLLCLLIASSLTAGEGKGPDFVHDGNVYLESHDYPRAMKAFEQAVRVDPNNADAHRGVGLAALKLGYSETSTNPEMIGNALAAFKEALRIAPNSAETRYQLGLVHLLLYDKGGAVGEYDALKSLDPGRAQQLLAAIDRYKPPVSFRTDRGSGGAGGNQTRVTVAGNHVIVPVTLRNGDRTVEATLILDTGASITLINKELAERLNINLNRSARASVHVVGGGVVQAWHARLDRVTVGEQTRTGVDVAVVQDSGAFMFEGLLGMNFLRSFKYSIDFSNQVINWTPL
jgi:clan AA aspartic protease (TIGR02281 family)